MNVSFAKPTATPVDGVTVESVTTAPAEHVIPATLEGGGPVIDVQATPVETAPAVTATVPAVIVDVPQAVVKAPSPVGLIDDQNIGFEDIILPRINIVQKVGELSEIFTPGEIVLKQALVIHTPAKGEVKGTAPLNITIIGFKKTQFAEKVAGGKQGILAHTEQEIAKHGGTLDYKEWDASVKANAEDPKVRPLRLFQRLATALCLVEKPEQIEDTDHVEFPYENEGKFYALVFWSMKGTAYTHAAKTMFTARKIGHLRQGYAKQSWSLTTKLEKFNENYAAVPVVKPAGKTSESFQKFVLDVIGME